MPMHDLDQKFETSWKKLRFRKRCPFLLWVGWIPYGYLIHSIHILFGLEESDLTISILLIAWCIIFIIAVIMLDEYRCPTCGEKFHAAKLSRPT